MLPKHSTGRLLDKLHRFGVYSCMGLTLYGISLGCYNAYYYVYYTKPAMLRRREELKLELIKEGQLNE